MNNRNRSAYASLILAFFAILLLIIYALTIPKHGPVTDWRGLLLLTPPIFGIPGIITAIIGQRKNVSPASILLIILHLIFIFWWPIIFYGGTLLFGP